ncbi:MAG TPA: NAD-dependent epimerase [Phycisphaerales bacterium]|nr:NAD-dependent epimerase [Phycisphaerales bacterium]HMP37930.1 NAD-dependent epimerase [Phycisphaerales bacterium]
MPTLVTGAAGFIGAATVHRLLDRGDDVVGVDNLNAYYDPKLKRDRLARIEARPDIASSANASASGRFRFALMDIADRAGMAALFREERFDRVVHLAAQAGVRHSLTHPHDYIDSNLSGTLNVLEGCRHAGTRHLVYASSSSVYGANAHLPFSTHDGVDHPVSLYAATKRANELMAHTYSHLFRLPTTGLRFFTVYGPWGRPDMALFTFTRQILAGVPITLYNEGRHRRDFTYIDDIVEGVVRALDHVAAPSPAFDPSRPDPATSSAPFRIYNIGHGDPGGPVELERYVEVIERSLGRTAQRTLLPLQPGDVEETAADIEDLATDLGYRPRVGVEEGVQRFIEWYREYYQERA